MKSIYEECVERTTWFRHDRFGLFIHWGLYAIPARGEWVRSSERMSVEAYQSYFDRFQPDQYDPKAWARMARDAGMRYAVMTAKHHDGFCLFDSQLTDYKSTQTPCGRDLIKEYVEAFRHEGIKVGLYYSLLDWHHPDYPHYGDDYHPMKENVAFRDVQHHFDRYLEYMHGQIRELLTGYGKIDIMWFDFSYGKMFGETWKAAELLKMLRELQPAIVVNSRLGGEVPNVGCDPYAGDFATPEQIIPSAQVVDALRRPLPWESCITQNGSWGFSRADNRYLSAKQTLNCLVNCVSKGGNLIVNAGPDARGVISAEQQRILVEIGQWLKINGDSIYGAGPSEFPKPEWGRLTQKGNRLFCHIQEPGMGTLTLPGLGKRLRNPRLLAAGYEIDSNFVLPNKNPEDAFMLLPRVEYSLDPVVEWEIVP